MIEQPIFKDCGKSFIPVIREVLNRLPEREREWIKVNVRFTQRHFCQRTLDDVLFKGYEKEAEDIWKEMNAPAATTWKWSRYHYVRLNPVILRYEDREDTLFTIAHELGHCFNWKPAKCRKDGEKCEQLADQWALERGFGKR